MTTTTTAASILGPASCFWVEPTFSVFTIFFPRSRLMERTGYIIQTPFYGESFWSLLLICKVDPASPATSSKTCGVVQTSSDVAIESIISEVCSKAAFFNHHPLILPVYMFNNHYSQTE